jgi:hypothetical protein
LERRELGKYRHVKLAWNDSSFLKGWLYGEGVFRDPVRRIETAGYVVENTPDHLVIAAHIDREGGGALCPAFIPWGAITALEEL